MTTTPILFDTRARRKHVARHAATRAQHDFLHREAASMIDESLQVMTPRFPRALVIDESGTLAPLLEAREGTQEVLTLSPDDLDREVIPFAENTLDAVVSNLALHTVNDLPGMFIQIRRALKPDGLFLAIMPGAETLRELRQVLADAETATRGGIAPRVAPFLEVRDAGNLLSRAGFALPVVDSTHMTVGYKTMFALLQELRGAGEANMLAERPKHFTPHRVFMEAAARYAAQHTDEEGDVIATAELIMLTAWKPAASQQQPAKRGSGKTSFMDALN